MQTREMNSNRLADFYRDQIENNLFRFWNNAVDRQNGGIFSCFNNAGTVLVSRNKYTWSQGRFVWVWSKLHELAERGSLSLHPAILKEDLDRTIRFLEEHVFMQNGNCVFLTDEYGNWIETTSSKGFDTSFYADCFIALGFSAYARVFKDRHCAELAFQTYSRINRRVKQGDFRSEPYPIPKGYRFHAVPMIMLNVGEELALTLETLGDEKSTEVENIADDYMNEIMEVFFDDGMGRVIETIGPGGAMPDNVLCRHVNPGHAIEDMWFVMKLAGRRNRADFIKNASRGVKSAIKMGWDIEYGGLYRFVDVSGGKPRGEMTGDAYESLILETWDTKLWWPHSEMLYATLLSYALTKDEEFVSLYDMAHEYVFSTFPDKSNNTGEWVQIRDRIGNPIDRVVALPVKDPYHIMRNMILIVELLEKW